MSIFTAAAALALLVVLAASSSATAFTIPVPASCDGGAPNTIPINMDAVGSATLIGTHPYGRLYVANPGPDNFTILHMFGKTAYENGLAHGALLKPQIEALVPMFTKYVERQINESLPSGQHLPPELLKFIATYGLDAALDLTALWTRPFTPQYYLDELRGIADGVGGGMTFDAVYRLFLVPELLKAACTVVGATGAAAGPAANGAPQQLRGLDFGFFPVLDFPLVSVYHFGANPIGPNTRDTAVFGWIVLNVGVLSGFSAGSGGSGGMSIGEKVLLKYGKKIDGVKGTPWMMLLRDAIAQHATVDDVVAFLQRANRTCAIHVGVGDAATGAFQGIEMAATLYHNYTWRTLGAWTGHPLIQDVFYWDKHMQNSHNPCLGDVLSSLGSNVTALNLVQVSAITQTGNLHAVSFDTGSQVAYFANARKSDVSAGDRNAYNRQFSRVNIKELFNMRQ